ncbi:MAG TPA: hypothetical protein VI457_11535 [Methylococcaceae bacterium]|nr:hypothetical protein [Methylococcaceae bacterium]
MTETPSRLLRAIAAALLLAGPAQAGGLQTLTLEGRARTPDGERGAQLSVECQPGSGGSLLVKLVVPGAYPAKQHFDFEAFEGPEPAAGNAKLTVLTVSGSRGRHQLRTDTGGWYSAEVEGAFVFATNQYDGFRKDLADLLGAAAQGESTFTWTQESYADNKLKVEAGFAIDAPTATRIHDTMAGCVAGTRNR